MSASKDCDNSLGSCGKIFAKACSTKFMKEPETRCFPVNHTCTVRMLACRSMSFLNESSRQHSRKTRVLHPYYNYDKKKTLIEQESTSFPEVGRLPPEECFPYLSNPTEAAST